MEIHLEFKTVENQWNKTFLFRKYFCRQRQRLKKTQHVLYFWKAGASRISNMILIWYWYGICFGHPNRKRAMLFWYRNTLYLRCYMHVWCRFSLRFILEDWFLPQNNVYTCSSGYILHLWRGGSLVNFLFIRLRFVSGIKSNAQ